MVSNGQCLSIFWCDWVFVLQMRRIVSSEKISVKTSHTKRYLAKKYRLVRLVLSRKIPSPLKNAKVTNYWPSHSHLRKCLCLDITWSLFELRHSVRWSLWESMIWENDGHHVTRGQNIINIDITFLAVIQLGSGGLEYIYLCCYGLSVTRPSQT